MINKISVAGIGGLSCFSVGKVSIPDAEYLTSRKNALKNSNTLNKFFTNRIFL